ncbi:MAG TPA: HypC/HybG/HupF family hydrogenase formation chaperone [Pirellulales bacterium]|nr:HypC/HybG/HupF family hydrogenase formation chaperone [Pirellulales bacterium]
MCLAIPGQITELFADPHDAERNSLAMVDILGVRRKVSIDLLQDDPPGPGDWVLIHVGFAMSKISSERAAEQLEMLAMLGEASTARDELFDGMTNIE